jgi:hypothetical protein
MDEEVAKHIDDCLTELVSQLAWCGKQPRKCNQSHDIN